MILQLSSGAAESPYPGWSGYCAAKAAVEGIARGLAVMIDILDPDAIVIGGGVGQTERLYAPETRDAIRRHLFNPGLRTDILRPALGDSAGVFGAALLAR